MERQQTKKAGCTVYDNASVCAPTLITKRAMTTFIGKGCMYCTNHYHLPALLWAPSASIFQPVVVISPSLDVELLSSTVLFTVFSTLYDYSNLWLFFIKMIFSRILLPNNFCPSLFVEFINLPGYYNELIVRQVQALNI